MNPFKNEQLVTLGGQEILLRPTFENIATLETETYSLAYIAWLYGGGAAEAVKDPVSGKVEITKKDKVIPPLTLSAKIIYLCQAEKCHDLETVFQMVLQEGIAVNSQVLKFISKITAGNKNVTPVEELTENQKKS